MRATLVVGMAFSMLFAVPLAAQTVASVACPAGMTAGGAPGTYTVQLTGPAPVGLTATPDSSNPAVAAVPAPFTIPTGATTFTFAVTPVTQGSADVGVTVNASRIDCALNVAAAAPPPVVAGAPLLGMSGLLVLASLLVLAGIVAIRRS